MPRLPVHTLQRIPGGDAGTLATLREMRSITRTWRKSPAIGAKASELISRCPPKNWACEARALHAFVSDNIRYQQDIADVETLRTPELTLSMRAGDCDDMCILLGSLLQSVGHPVRFVAASFAPDAEFSHVFLETKIANDWWPAECTEPWPFGAAPPGIVRDLTVFV